MNPERLIEILNAYGADPMRWPAEEREAARALLACAPEVRATLREAMDLDHALRAWTNPVEPPFDAARLSARITASRPRPGVFRPLFRRRSVLAWPSVAGLAAAAVAGFLVGWAGPDFNLRDRTDAELVDRLALLSTIEDATW
ncbi:MAG TPA: hypothetical protein VF342_17225 [Alphaproteobacteria bacterium]